MKELLSLVGNKYFLWIVIVLGALGVFGLRGWQEKKYNDALETYQRQLNGQLTEKERELQALHSELGVARSELMTQKELAKTAEKEKQELDKEFQAFVKKHKLEISSRDLTIASLRQQLSGGDTDVVVSDNCNDIDKRCVISYSWQDTLKRFKLKDPNIFTENDEVFESNQLFKIYGEVYQQKDGSLQTRRVVLREITRLGDGNYEEIPNAKAEVVDASFQYVNPPTIDDLSPNLFKLRFIALGSVFLYPNPGNTRVGAGLEFFNFKGFGINTHISFDTGEDTSLHLGTSYSPKIFNTPLNLAIGMSYGTPFMDFFREHSLSVDFIFYINN